MRIRVDTRGSASVHQYLAWALIPAFHFFLCPVLIGADVGQEQIDFFEKKIRPVLAQRCYLCHSAQSKPAMAGLRLDTRDAVLKGGDSGPAILPGDPAKSLLIKAILYNDLRLRMPPMGKLSDVEIADFVVWVKMGAPDPRSERPLPVASSEKNEMDFATGRRFWSFQAVRDAPRPKVTQKDWP